LWTVPRKANISSIALVNPFEEVPVTRRPQHPAAGKAVVYLRLSGQPYGYDPFSLENQRRICRERALHEHVEIVAEHQDPAISGRKGEAERPGFEASLNLIRRQLAETMYVAGMDRFSRRGMHYVRALLDEVDRAGGRVLFVADGLDSRETAVRQAIEAHAEQARAEADAATRRLSEWHAHNRRKGLWKRIRPFGYLVNDGRLVPHPTEAPIVRGMVDGFLAGSSLRGIAMGLNAQGVKPPRLVFYEEATAKGYSAKRPSATSWSYVAVRGILTAPALAALTSHGGEPCRDEHDQPIFAGVGIVDLGERSRILEELRRRAMSRGALRATRGDGRRDTRPKYLLTGFGRCGECGKALQRIETLRGGVYYRCASKGRGQTCRGALIPGRLLESEVVRSVLERRARSAQRPVSSLDESMTSAWEDLSLARRRAVLADAIQEVQVFGTDVPLDRRMHIVWIGENPPAPRRRR
jgi:DNA invertase Pin-like site-specific DNA recombinase